MEENTNNKQTPYQIKNYLHRLSNYSSSGAIVGIIVSAAFLLKFKKCFFFGLGIGAGYCHQDLVNFCLNLREKKKITLTLD